MMAAIIAAKNGASVVLLEKNEKLGKKLYITGKGRCNVTNDCIPRDFLQNIASNPKFLTSALYAFPPQSALSFFEEYGLQLKTERGNRVFPISDKSSDVTAAFIKAISDAGVSVRLKEKVLSLTAENGMITGVKTDKGVYTPDKVIIATGGLSYPLTGSTGDGYRMAASLGHTVVPPVPALTSIVLDTVFDVNEGPRPISTVPYPHGLSLKNVNVNVLGGGFFAGEEFGEMLFTDDGVSGPVILTLSSKINRKDLSELRLTIDLKPALSEETLDDRVLRDFKAAENKQFKNALNELLPKSLIPFIIDLSCIPPEKPVNVITKTERKNFVKLLKNISFGIRSLGGMNEAIVTAGGISVAELDPRTMKSKLYNNLYFAGELIDVDGFTGGFNIQIALSTGYLAGQLK